MSEGNSGAATSGQSGDARKPRNLSLTANPLRLTTPQPARNPNPAVKAPTLAYMIFERPDLDRAEKFLKDFGMRTAHKTPDVLLMRGIGEAPYCYVALRGPKARFVGLAFTVASLDDLNKLAAFPEASLVETIDWPGGGKRVRMKDPAGLRVDILWGQEPAPTLPHRAAIKMNEPENLVRIDGVQRLPPTPPEIVKLGHLQLGAPNFQEVCAWYTGRLGLLPSDICVLPDGEPGVCFFRLDLGDKPADHHTLALSIHFMTDYGHSAYEVVDADAVGMGQRILQNKGWRHAWGIGRHILGSQIFDYWEDPWGAKHEHYCDGDVFTAAKPAEIHALSRNAMAQWGPAMPKRFTRPTFSFENLRALARNLRAHDDLSVKKIITLLKLVG